MYYGFTGFCEEFLRQHPGYTIHLIRLSGSAVETLFSQLKYASGGNLMSINYSSARASIFIKGGMSGNTKETITEIHHYLYANISLKNQSSYCGTQH